MNSTSRTLVAAVSLLFIYLTFVVCSIQLIFPDASLRNYIVKFEKKYFSKSAVLSESFTVDPRITNNDTMDFNSARGNRIPEHFHLTDFFGNNSTVHSRKNTKFNQNQHRNKSTFRTPGDVHIPYVEIFPSNISKNTPNSNTNFFIDETLSENPFSNPRLRKKSLRQMELMVNDNANTFRLDFETLKNRFTKYTTPSKKMDLSKSDLSSFYVNNQVGTVVSADSAVPVGDGFFFLIFLALVYLGVKLRHFFICRYPQSEKSQRD